MGLFISKQITDQLNGTIGFKKTDDGLTNIFYFTVPCEIPE
jgi:signal transduction histidine kinase